MLDKKTDMEKGFRLPDEAGWSTGDPQKDGLYIICYSWENRSYLGMDVWQDGKWTCERPEELKVLYWRKK